MTTSYSQHPTSVVDETTELTTSTSMEVKVTMPSSERTQPPLSTSGEVKAPTTYQVVTQAPIQKYLETTATTSSAEVPESPESQLSRQERVTTPLVKSGGMQMTRVSTSTLSTTPLLVAETREITTLSGASHHRCLFQSSLTASFVIELEHMETRTMQRS